MIAVILQTGEASATSNLDCPKSLNAATVRRKGVNSETRANPVGNPIIYPDGWKPPSTSGIPA
jgi:hypothetical protein